MGLIDRLFGRAAPARQAALYGAVVARGREPHWYEAGVVPDTIDGRFDMIAAVLSMALLRLEEEPEGAEPAARLAERFVEDMDGQLRQIGVGDLMVGKHVGRMMGMLGGRLGAYRSGLASGDLGPALVRNLYRGEAPPPDALAHVVRGLTDLRGSLDGVSIAALAEGTLP